MRVLDGVGKTASAQVTNASAIESVLLRTELLISKSRKNVHGDPAVMELVLSRIPFPFPLSSHS